MSTGETNRPSGQLEFEPNALASVRLEMVCANQAGAVLPAARSIIALLSPFASGSELSWIELALQEAIRNAYEHGNLGFSSSEKARLCETDSFDKAVREREKQLSEEGKRIRLFIRISSEELSCSIEDDGEGFDWQAALSSSSREDLPLEELRGRGLLLIAKVFDTVAYNEKGNKVTLRKRLPLA